MKVSSRLAWSDDLDTVPESDWLASFEERTEAAIAEAGSPSYGTARVRLGSPPHPPLFYGFMVIIVIGMTILMLLT